LPGLPVYLFLPHNSSHSFGSSVAMHWWTSASLWAVCLVCME
jgi:hypothetical protein